ncbi:hypothetical protein BD560DRAFT_432598 [Blakeslea trispora]|nr:hypothetical protein BD560DRAFT_432598 [Blakeslea trispora]
MNQELEAELDMSDILIELEIRVKKEVKQTNRHHHSNQISLDFANTKEIPAFLRNWNVNKKRKFKPRLSSSSPAKMQRRTGPDFAP